MRSVSFRGLARSQAWPDFCFAPPLMKSVLVSLLVVAACSSSSSPPAENFVLNGFDIPVVVTIEPEGGGSTRLELKPKSYARPHVSGKAKVKVTTAKGDLISENEAHFAKPGTKGCYSIYNVMGAAAYVHEDVLYGEGIGAATVRQRAGTISERECGVSYAFVEPPDSVTVDRYGPAGDNRGWLHLVDDGSWVIAVNTLLDDTGEFASQSRGKAQRIVRAVVTHDPNNPALPAIAERLQKLGLAVPESKPGNLLAPPERRRPRR